MLVAFKFNAFNLLSCLNFVNFAIFCSSARSPGSFLRFLPKWFLCKSEAFLVMVEFLQRKRGAEFTLIAKPMLALYLVAGFFNI